MEVHVVAIFYMSIVYCLYQLQIWPIYMFHFILLITNPPRYEVFGHIFQFLNVLLYLGQIILFCLFIHSLFTWFLVMRYVLMLSRSEMIGIDLARKIMLLKLSQILFKRISYLVSVLKYALDYEKGSVFITNQLWAFSSNSFKAAMILE